MKPASDQTAGTVIRPALSADLPAILDVYNDAVARTTASYDYEPRTLEHRTQWFEDHLRDDLPVLVAADGSGRILGWSSLSRYHARIGYRFTLENSIYIAEAHRGQGLGSLLLTPLLESARLQGYRAIIAAIDASNTASVRLHAKHGFQEVGLFKSVGFKFDRWLDVLYMEYLLPESAESAGKSNAASSGSIPS